MKTLYIIDSYAWVEYFIGSKKGNALKKLLENKNNNFITIECCLAEIKGWSLKNNLDFQRLLNIIISNSKIMAIEMDDWINAAEEKFIQQKTKRDFGLIDAILLSKQKQLGCRIITGDKHFKGIQSIAFIE